MQDPFFAARFIDQTQSALRQITQSTMQQPARSAAGARSEIELLDQPDFQAPHRRVPRHARPDNPAANDQQIQLIGNQPEQWFQNGADVIGLFDYSFAQPSDRLTASCQR